jgi:hypothetical protein
MKTLKRTAVAIDPDGLALWLGVSGRTLRRWRQRRLITPYRAPIDARSGSTATQSAGVATERRVLLGRRYYLAASSDYPTEELRS